MAASHGKSWTSSKTCKRSLASSEHNEPESRDSAPQRRSLFGRRIGRPLSAQKKEALERWLPVLSIPHEKLRSPGALQPSSLFNRNFSSVWFEIGFGYGEHLIALARKNPQTAFLGAEPFLNGMAAFLSEVDAAPMDNVRVLMDDALILARALADDTLDGIYILNPDPWHKTRHQKRRIVNRKNLDIFHRLLKPGGLLVMTSDVEPMAEWMVTQASLHPGFEWTARKSEDWQVPPEDWIKTRYETKGAKNAKKMSYLFFRKKDETPQKPLA